MKERAFFAARFARDDGPRGFTFELKSMISLIFEVVLFCRLVDVSAVDPGLAPRALGARSALTGVRFPILHAALLFHCGYHPALSGYSAPCIRAVALITAEVQADCELRIQLQEPLVRIRIPHSAIRNPK